MADDTPRQAGNPEEDIPILTPVAQLPMTFFDHAVLAVRRDNGSIYLAIRALARPWMSIALLMPLAVLLLSACQPSTAPPAQRRVPAEWEPLGPLAARSLSPATP